MASEREGLSRSRWRHLSIISLQSEGRRTLMIGSCPEAGRPRFFCVTIFEFDMRRVLQQSPFTGNRVLPNNPSHLSYYKKPLGSVWSWHHRGCGTRRREPGRLGDRAAAPRDRRRRASKIPVIPVFSQQLAFCPICPTVEQLGQTVRRLSRRGT